MSIALLFWIIAAILFGLATFGIGSPRFNMLAAGLLSASIAVIVGALGG